MEGLLKQILKEKIGTCGGLKEEHSSKHCKEIKKISHKPAEGIFNTQLTKDPEHINISNMTKLNYPTPTKHNRQASPRRGDTNSQLRCEKKNDFQNKVVTVQ